MCQNLFDVDDVSKRWSELTKSPKTIGIWIWIEDKYKGRDILWFLKSNFTKFILLMMGNKKWMQYFKSKTNWKYYLPSQYPCGNCTQSLLHKAKQVLTGISTAGLFFLHDIEKLELKLLFI